MYVYIFCLLFPLVIIIYSVVEGVKYQLKMYSFTAPEVRGSIPVPLSVTVYNLSK